MTRLVCGLALLLPTLASAQLSDQDFQVYAQAMLAQECPGATAERAAPCLQTLLRLLLQPRATQQTAIKTALQAAKANAQATRSQQDAMAAANKAALDQAATQTDGIATILKLP